MSSCLESQKSMSWADEEVENVYSADLSGDRTLFLCNDQVIGKSHFRSESTENVIESKEKLIYFSGMNIYVVSNKKEAVVFSAKGLINEKSRRPGEFPGGTEIGTIFKEHFGHTFKAFGDKFRDYEGVHHFILTGKEYVNFELVKFNKYCLIYLGTCVNDNIITMFEFRTFSQINDPYPDFIYSNIESDENVNPTAFINYDVVNEGTEKTVYDEKNKLSVFENPRKMANYKIYKYMPANSKLAEKIYILTQTNQTDNMSSLIFNLMQYRKQMEKVKEDHKAYFPDSQECSDLITYMFENFPYYYDLEKLQNIINKKTNFNKGDLEPIAYEEGSSKIDELVILSCLLEVMPYQRHERLWNSYVEYRKVRKILIALANIICFYGPQAYFKRFNDIFKIEKPCLEKTRDSFNKVVGTLANRYSYYRYKGDNKKTEEFVDSFIGYKRGSELYAIKRFVDNFPEFKF